MFGIGKSRMTFEIANETKARLEALRKRIKVENAATVVQRALATYELLVHERDAGSVIVVRATDGTERDLALE